MHGFRPNVRVWTAAWAYWHRWTMGGRAGWLQWGQQWTAAVVVRPRAHRCGIGAEGQLVITGAAVGLMDDHARVRRSLANATFIHI